MDKSFSDEIAVFLMLLILITGRKYWIMRQSDHSVPGLNRER